MRKGQKRTPEHNAKLRARFLGQKRPSMSNENHPRWKGDSVSYQALHNWLRTNHPKTGVCDHCSQNRKTDYANVSGKYRRDRSDYLELCRSCHKTFDLAKV